MGCASILPGTGRGTAEGGGGGAQQATSPGAGPLHHATALRGPPPRAGEDFGSSAARLAGMAGLAFGWSPDAFWNATPAELGALVRAALGDEPAPLGAGEIARLKELFPDG
jgi:hypothetical protein